ncbi:unnamed protein product [Calicophoron daubneyi]|uniref:Protein DPCD n=1 Tax=Calicophoron daubneyi TaxID=300641 RepID=A0AAV2T4K6_CALDB
MATGCSWLERLKAAKKALLIQDGKRKVHYTFADGTEMVEEYDSKANSLLSRKWKIKSELGGDGKWEFEVGEPVVPHMVTAMSEINESNTNPRFSRCDTNKAFQWRIRNLPYPLSTYSVKAEENNQTLVLRTSNKKYFKKFDIPDMKRLNLNLSESAISLSHANNTLLISYKKPDEVLEFEKLLKEHLSSVKPVDEGQGDCKTS